MKNYYIIQGDVLYMGTETSPDKLYDKNNPQPVLGGGMWDIVGSNIYFYGETSKHRAPSLLLVTNCVRNGNIPKMVKPLNKYFTIFPSYDLAKTYGVQII